MESLCSSLGVAEFGHVFSHEELCEAIAKFSSDSVRDLLEYVSRDVLNLALENSDNYARNTAFLKRGPDVRLSPLYDLAPMELDPEGIRRAVRWKGEYPLRPDWSYVATVLGKWMDRRLAVNHLQALSARVRALPEIAHRFQLPDPVFEHCQPRWERLATDLKKTR